MKSISKYSYRNSANRDLDLVIEPDGEHYLIKSNQVVEIVVGSRVEGCIEFEQTPDGLVVWGFPSTIISVQYEGKELDPFFPE
jgi:hypothetical protein